MDFSKNYCFYMHYFKKFQNKKIPISQKFNSKYLYFQKNYTSVYPNISYYEGKK